MPHRKQIKFINSRAPRKIIRAGRRAGKTVGMAILAVLAFREGKRVLYGAPTTDQVERFWAEVTRALAEPIAAGLFRKNETRHTIDVDDKHDQRIRAKTCWNADTLRGDYADLLILDEWQLMDENAWELVGAPMLLDNNGDAVFVYTPPSLHSRSVSKARDPQHAAKMFKRAEADESGRWAAFHFTSHENPYISRDALSDLTHDMTNLAYRMEIEAEDIDEAPGALWTREIIDAHRVMKAPDLDWIVVGVDPSATSTGDECGIVTVGRKGKELYVLSDNSLQGSPAVWARAVCDAYHYWEADQVVAESNQGGEMVELTIHTADPSIPVRLVHASRGKQPRAEPVSAHYEHGHVHHIGNFPALENELCLWLPGDASPNRLDALVWAARMLGVGTDSRVSIRSLDDYKKDKEDLTEKEALKRQEEHLVGLLEGDEAWN